MYIPLSNEAESSYFSYLFDEFNSFRGAGMRKFMYEYQAVFYLIAVLYLLMVHVGPKYIHKPLRLKPWFIAWNAFLAIFSMFGAYYSLPTLLDMYFGHFSEPSPQNPLYRGDRRPGLYTAMCWWEPDIFFNYRVGLWLWLFAMSKIPEMIDTMFLVLQKKPVIFLHWWHHATVMLYCWHCYTYITPAGLAFSTMNYCVHSIMYTYYFVCACGYRHVVRPFAFLITSLQIAQMVVGMAIESYLFYQVFISGNRCDASPSNVLLGFAMYLSYFILFSQLYYNSYVKKRPRAVEGAAAVAAGALPVTPTPVPQLAKARKNRKNQ